jgi:hypothetical protein
VPFAQSTSAAESYDSAWLSLIGMPSGFEARDGTGCCGVIIRRLVRRRIARRKRRFQCFIDRSFLLLANLFFCEEPII